jgi:hypothetical protein
MQCWNCGSDDLEYRRVLTVRKYKNEDGSVDEEHTVDYPLVCKKCGEIV